MKGVVSYLLKKPWPEQLCQVVHALNLHRSEVFIAQLLGYVAHEVMNIVHPGSGTAIHGRARKLRWINLSWRIGYFICVRAATVECVPQAQVMPHFMHSDQAVAAIARVTGTR